MGGAITRQDICIVGRDTMTVDSSTADHSTITVDSSMTNYNTMTTDNCMKTKPRRFGVDQA